MRFRAALSLLALFAGTGTALAEGPFDGQWTGEMVTELGRCAPRRSVTMEVTDGVAKGEAIDGRVEPLNISATISDDGRVRGPFASNGGTVIKVRSGRFAGGSATLSWFGHSDAPLFAEEAFDSCEGIMRLQRTDS